MNTQRVTQEFHKSPSPPNFTDYELQQALNSWRRDVLAWLGREMLAAAEDFRDAQDGLAIAHRNPGEVADDVISLLWDDLNHNAVLLRRLDRVVFRIEELTLPQLIVLFQRTTKKETYPWEGAAWQLPASIF